MTKAKLAYLGPVGAFSELIAHIHYVEAHELIPLPTVDEIFDYVAADPASIGVVPI